jgi:hypothetical protein
MECRDDAWVKLAALSAMPYERVWQRHHLEKEKITWLINF